LLDIGESHPCTFKRERKQLLSHLDFRRISLTTKIWNNGLIAIETKKIIEIQNNYSPCLRVIAFKVKVKARMFCVTGCKISMILTNKFDIQTRPEKEKSCFYTRAGKGPLSIE
jgi:hypothetical protein